MYFLKSLHVHLGDSCDPAEFISFNKNDYHAFIGIENHMLETLTVLMNIFGKEGIVFSCRLMHQEKTITGVEVCLNRSELERLNQLYKL